MQVTLIAIIRSPQAKNTEVTGSSENLEEG